MNIVMQSLSEYGIKKGDSIMALTLATPEFIFLMYNFIANGRESNGDVITIFLLSIFPSILV